MQLRKRILNAALKRGGVLTQSQLTRYVIRVSNKEKQKEIKALVKDGFMEAITINQTNKTGVNPMRYHLTPSGLELAS
ncbi:MAG TPA: hypothetical protein EYN54_12195 [Methylococcaceae bacterium]|nr:hypothetical protein [Methylococcaceae bacterium]